MDIKLSNLPRERLEDMFEAAHVVLETMRVLRNAKTNVSKDIIRFTDHYREWDHVPPGDVFDRQTHSQYYFHTHAKSKDKKGIHDDEHGHFHTYLRAKGMPDGLKPVKLDDFDPDKDVEKPNDVNAHIIAIATDKYGQPMRLFTTNRWVVADMHFKAEDVIKMIDHFNIDHSNPSWPVNLWVSNMIRLYRPHIEQLILQRDKTIEDWQKKHPDRNVFEDRELEVTSCLDINLEQHIDDLEAALNNQSRQTA